MLKVGIYTPYVRNEITLAATQFADWLLRCGIDVHLVSDGKIEKGIHPVWDQKVKHGRKKAVYAWAYGATHLCWFSADTRALDWARLVSFDAPKLKTHHYFFPYWSHWSAACDHFLSNSDRVICLSQDLFNWLNNLRRPDILLHANRTWANLVSAETLLIPKHGRMDKYNQYLLGILPKTTALDLGDSILDVFDYLLQVHPHLFVTLLLENSLPRNLRTKLHKMVNLYRERLTLITSPSYYSYTTLARSHDWVYLANTRHRLGSMLSLLVPSSVPIVCHDIPPVGGHINNGVNGILIPCDLFETTVPIAKVDVDTIATSLEKVIEQPSVALKALQLQGAQQYTKKQKSFENFLYKEFLG